MLILLSLGLAAKTAAGTSASPIATTAPATAWVKIMPLPKQSVTLKPKDRKESGLSRNVSVCRSGLPPSYRFAAASSVASQWQSGAPADVQGTSGPVAQ